MASVAYNIYLASEGFYVLRSGVLAVLGCGDGCGHMWRTPQGHRDSDMSYKNILT